MSVSGNNLDYLTAFLGGVVLSFTPCIYPLIPITASYIAVEAAGFRLKGLFLSLIYVTGMAITYSILGLSASLAGKVFGTISEHSITNIVMGVIIVLFGLSMLGMFNIILPNIIRLPRPKKQGYFSTFLLGLGSGFLVSPCITPVLGAILAYLVTKKNILYGVTLLFSFAYGMGLILIVTGIFSSTILSFLKAGKWMVYIKRLCALVLICMGVYFILKGVM